VRKEAWPRGSTDDLSFKTLAVLGAGLSIWIGYGTLKHDYFIILANAIGLALVVTFLSFIWRDPLQGNHTRSTSQPF
jgi:uncharacterized protein with PQ loop repeat